MNIDEAHEIINNQVFWRSQPTTYQLRRMQILLNGQESLMEPEELELMEAIAVSLTQHDKDMDRMHEERFADDLD